MRRALVGVLFVLLAPVVQVGVVNRLALPGGGPGIVLVGVVALAPWFGPSGAALLGFAAGLAADIAPPADHTAGRLALALCLAGWFCGRVPPDRPAGTRMAAAAAAALGATVLDTALAPALGDARWAAAVAQVPGALAWTVGGTAVAAGALALLPRRRRRLGIRASRSPYERRERRELLGRRGYRGYRA
jgi:hypothetical protein